jgi:2-phospho-L-lactate guanylyltransferase (CobY/MobA/RfbA family)
MKIVLVFFILITTSSFSQEKFLEAKVVNPSEFLKSKNSGVFEFLFPQKAEKTTVLKNAVFYSTYFKVDFNETSKIAKITMLNNDAQSRQIINRFLISNKISQIEMNGNLLKIDEFYQKHLK